MRCLAATRNVTRAGLRPRQLEPTTSYLAAIVPAFESGRRAGLNQDPDGQSPLQPAWTDGVTSLQLPMYYGWEFRTGIGGDFESMVRSLRPRPLPENTGRQKVFVGAAGSPLPRVDADHDGGVVELPGALVLPGSEEPAWPSATQATVRTALAKLLNTTAQRTGVADGSGTQASPRKKMRARAWIELMGTLGVAVAAFRNGQVDDLRQIILDSALQACGFRMR